MNVRRLIIIHMLKQVHFLSSGEGGQGAVVGAAGALAAGAAGAGASSCGAATGGFFFIRFLEGVAGRTA
jgi:hypothetical protein